MAKKSNKYLDFVDDNGFRAAVKAVLNPPAKKKSKDDDDELYSNAIDPFSAVLDSLRQGISLTEWMAQEKVRQAQKTLQNAIGEFHQALIGCLSGWETLPVGSVIDVRNKKKKIIAEVKNKYNTTKGNHKKSVYDDLKSILAKADHKGFTAYYVEVIPKKRQKYDKAFTPPDNVTKKNRPNNSKIRVIDGSTFYALASGRKSALKDIYDVLPQVVADVVGGKSDKILKDKLFHKLFDKTF